MFVKMSQEKDNNNNQTIFASAIRESKLGTKQLSTMRLVNELKECRSLANGLNEFISEAHKENLIVAEITLLQLFRYISKKERKFVQISGFCQV